MLPRLGHTYVIYVICITRLHVCLDLLVLNNLLNLAASRIIGDYSLAPNLDMLRKSKIPLDANTE